MATHSSILTWEIPWREELSGQQSMGSQRIGHDLGTKQQQQHTYWQTALSDTPVPAQGFAYGR